MAKDTERTVTLFPHYGPGPKRIILEYYDDNFTPLDVVAGMMAWFIDNPGYLQEWARYIAGEDTNSFTEKEAKRHFEIVAEMLYGIHSCRLGFDVHVTGAGGRVN